MVGALKVPNRKFERRLNSWVAVLRLAIAVSLVVFCGYVDGPTVDLIITRGMRLIDR